MVVKLAEKSKAISLRREGKTYSEILKEVSVAKSTLTLWFQDVGLSKKQKQAITQKRIAAQLRGAAARHMQRLDQVAAIHGKSRKEVGALSKRELWLAGVMLYWAEGSKQREGVSPSAGVLFSNSDPGMVKIFVKWLYECAKVSPERLRLEIYTHDMYKNRVGEMRSYWASVTGRSVQELERVYYKRDKPKTKRSNLGETYFGQLRIGVRSSTVLNRQINGWVLGVLDSLKLN